LQTFAFHNSTSLALQHTKAMVPPEKATAKCGFKDNESGADGSTSCDTEIDRLTPSSVKNEVDGKIARGARATVLLVLLISAVTVATLAYILLSESENESFKAQVRA
jgi:hypothetical protein